MLRALDRGIIWVQGYKTFSLFSSAEYVISNAHKY